MLKIRREACGSEQVGDVCLVKSHSLKFGKLPIVEQYTAVILAEVHLFFAIEENMNSSGKNKLLELMCKLDDLLA